MAGGTIGSLAVNVVAKTDPFARGMRKGRQELTLFQSAVGSLNRVMIGFGVTMAGSFTLGAIRQTISELDNLSDTAAQLGTTVEALSRLQYAGFLADVSDGSLSRALTYMQKNLGMNSTEIRRFGLDIERLRKLDAVEMFIQIAEAINRMPDAAAKTAAAMAVFGRSGADLMELIMQGRGGIEAAMAGANVVPTEADIARAAEADKAIKELALAWKELRTQVTLTLLEDGEVAKFLRGPIDDVQTLVRWIKNLRAAIEEFDREGQRFVDELAVSLGMGDWKSTRTFRRERAAEIAEAEKFLAGEKERTIASWPADLRAEFARLDDPMPRSTITGTGGLGLGAAIMTPAMQAAIDAFMGELSFHRQEPSMAMLSRLDRYIEEQAAAMEVHDLPEPDRRGGQGSARGFSALEAGTAEAFRQERLSASQTIDVSRQILTENKNQTKELQKIDANLKAQQQLEVVNMV